LTLEHGGPDLGAEIRWDFSTNANPMGPMAGAMHALAEADRRTYPEPTYLALRTALSGAGLGPVDRLLPTAGNAEAIRRLTLAAKLAGTTQVWVPGPGYGEYRAAAEVLGLAVRAYGSVAELAAQWQPASGRQLIWLCEPCNPTGEDVSADTWAQLLAWLPTWQAAGHTLAVDRAYAPMRLDGLDPLPSALAQAAWQLWSPNKTMGCTGVRAGLMVAPADAAASQGWPDVAALAPSWVLGSEGVALLQAWVSDSVQGSLRVQRVVWRAWLQEQQRALRERGWQVRESVVPFFLAQPPQGVDVAAMLTGLRQRGIKLRDAASLGLPGWCRLRVMSPAAQAALMDALGALGQMPVAHATSSDSPDAEAA
jgi:histidinol-phosphate aminotransferase